MTLTYVALSTQLRCTDRIGKSHPGHLFTIRNEQSLAAVVLLHIHLLQDTQEFFLRQALPVDNHAQFRQSFLGDFSQPGPKYEDDGQYENRGPSRWPSYRLGENSHTPVETTNNSGDGKRQERLKAGWGKQVKTSIRSNIVGSSCWHMAIVQ